MKKIISLLVLSLLMPVVAFANNKEHERIDNSIAVLAGLVNALVQKTSGLESQIGSINQKIAVFETQIGAISGSNKHYIGQEYRGGLVFYVDESREHGLIASKVDVSGMGVQWRNGAAGNKITNARGDGIGAGETNTRLIISQQTIDNQTGQFAALLAANFQVLEDGVTPCKTPVAAELVCFGGWYLPSAYELQLLHNNLHISNVTTFAPEFYWSSTEASVSNAWLQNFSTGEIMASNKASTIGRVRAINRF